MGPNTRPWGLEDRKALFLLSGLAIAVRTFLAVRTPVIGADSTTYLLFAQDILRGEWNTGLLTQVHPAYPWAVAMLSTLLRSVEAAGYAISVLFGSLAVVPLYALAREVMGYRPAILTGLIWVCMPRLIREHSDIMTEGFFHFWILSSFALAWLGARRGSFWMSLLAGATGGAAYLTRPEGISAALALPGAAAVILAMARLRKDPLRPRILLHAAAGCCALALIAFPLVQWYKQATGRWMITPRASFDKALQGFSSERKASGDDESVSTRTLLLAGAAAAAVAAAAWALRRRADAGGTIYLLCGAGGIAAVPLAAASADYALSLRHLLLPGALLLPFLALILIMLADQAGRWWGRPSAHRVALDLVGLTLVFFAYMGARERRSEELPLKEAALWIRATSGPGTQVRANTDKVGYYVGRKVLPMPATASELGSLQLGPKEYILVIEHRLARRLPEGMDTLERRFQRVARFPPELTAAEVLRVSVFAPRP